MAGKTQAEIMREAGYVTASEAADAIGASQVGTVHRMVHDERLAGARAGKHWYVLVSSLLDMYADAPPIVARIKALGVKPVKPKRKDGAA